MSYAILRVAKHSMGSVSGVQKHNQREYKNHSNLDIDKSKSYLNYDLVNKKNINFSKAWKENKEKYFKEGNRFRKDTIVLVEGIITSDKSFFENMNDKEVKDYFETNLDFLKNEYGAHNIISANVHLDESTPHMHFTFTPITKDGRFSAKEIIGTRGDLRQLQDRYHKHLADKGYELLRGVQVEQTKAKHKAVKEYKKNQIDKDYEYVKELKYEISKKEILMKDYEKKLNDFTKHYDEVVKVLDNNSLNISQINMIKTEELGGLFKSNSDYLKIRKVDFNKLKNSAIKAYEQHTLYATVSDQLESKEKLKETYKKESEEYRRKWESELNEKRNSIHRLNQLQDKERQLHNKELDLYKKELGHYKKFITENKIESNFKEFKYKEREKEKEKIQKKVQMKKTKEIELER